MPTNLKARKALRKHLPTSIKGAAYELGSGFGSVLPLLKKRYQNVVGFETSPVPYLFSRVLHKNVHREDFFDVDLSDAGLVYCYLFPGAMKRLKEKFLEELRPGTHIFSNAFSMPQWTPTAIYPIEDIYHSNLYHWILPKSSK
ncbi:MAG: hypothetical protein SP1CHLAM54_02020 [Chlamydiia bacterium]|nr:hypothetical protein [Chlamydiia bacterium]MCH9615120.1 hypothetical protein [Chlamydiia bacterium]MCH9628558.1 hypothetical protein [Chlamydiia bacterium]